MTPNPETLVSLDYFRTRGGFSKTTFSRMLKNGALPPHARLSPRKIVFRLGDVDRFFAERFDASATTRQVVQTIETAAPPAAVGGAR